MKKFIYASFIGALICSTLVGWFSPQILTWYFTPPMDLVISCKPAVEWGIYAYRKIILVSGLFGFVAGAVVYFFTTRSRTSPKPNSI